MRALYPDEDGYVDRDGIKIFYEIYGSGRPTVVLMPTWSIIHSRFWKMQIPYLARHFRVVTFDGRGNGKSGRPAEADAYAESEFVKDTLAVMDVTETQSAVLVCLSLGAQRTLLLAADHPDRVEGAVFIGASLPIAPGHPERSVYSFDDRLKAHEGWAKFNRHYWTEDFKGFLQFFFEKCFTEPHSTKPIEDCVGWGLETAPETLVATTLADSFEERDEVLAGGGADSVSGSGDSRLRRCDQPTRTWDCFGRGHRRGTCSARRFRPYPACARSRESEPAGA